MAKFQLDETCRYVPGYPFSALEARNTNQVWVREPPGPIYTRRGALPLTKDIVFPPPGGTNRGFATRLEIQENSQSELLICTQGSPSDPDYRQFAKTGAPLRFPARITTPSILLDISTLPMFFVVSHSMRISVATTDLGECVCGGNVYGGVLVPGFQADGNYDATLAGQQANVESGVTDTSGVVSCGDGTPETMSSFCPADPDCDICSRPDLQACIERVPQYNASGSIVYCTGFSEDTNTPGARSYTWRPGVSEMSLTFAGINLSGNTYNRSQTTPGTSCTGEFDDLIGGLSVRGTIEDNELGQQCGDGVIVIHQPNHRATVLYQTFDGSQTLFRDPPSPTGPGTIHDHLAVIDGQLYYDINFNSNLPAQFWRILNA